MNISELDTITALSDQDTAPQIDFVKYLKGIWKRKWIPPLVALLVAAPLYLQSDNYVPLYRCEVTIKTQSVNTETGPIINQERLAEMQSRVFFTQIAAKTGLSVVLIDSVYKNYDQVFSLLYTSENPVEGRYIIRIEESDNYSLIKIDKSAQVKLDSANIWDAVSVPREINGLTFLLSDMFVTTPREIAFAVRPFEKAVDEIKDGVRMRLYKTGILLLQMDGRDPAILPNKLNRIAEAYVQEIIKLKSRDVNQARDILQKRLEVANSEIETVASDLRDYNMKYPLSINSERESLQNDLKDCDRALATIPRQREQLSELLDRLNQPSEISDEKQYRRYIVHALANFAGLADEPNMVVLRQTLAQQEKTYNTMLEQTSLNYPPLIELDKELQKTEDKIIALASKHRNTLVEMVDEYKEKEAQIKSSLKSLPNDEYLMGELDRKKGIVERQVTFLYSELQKLQVADVVKNDEIRILDRALPPSSPINASTNQKVLLGGGAGLFLGLVICIVLELMDKKIRTPMDVEEQLGLKVLGVIPVVGFKDIPEYHDFEKVKHIDRQLVTHDYSPTQIGESYRALRTHLMFSKNTGQIRTLLLTSISPEEGKSFTASNLAIILAQQRTNTLLVDADLRRGVLHNTFGMDKDPGLTNYLSTNATLSSIVQQTHIPNLSLISCGPMIPNPSELLGSLQMRRFLEETKRKFDIILFDTPPLDAATDSVVLGSQVDAVAVVVRSGKTNYKTAKEKLDIFQTIPANLIGVILNGSETALLKNTYSYYHY